jgi:hypothetical protein
MAVLKSHLELVEYLFNVEMFFLQTCCLLVTSHFTHVGSQILVSLALKMEVSPGPFSLVAEEVTINFLLPVFV